MAEAAVLEKPPVPVMRESHAMQAPELVRLKDNERGDRFIAPGQQCKLDKLGTKYKRVIVRTASGNMYQLNINSETGDKAEIINGRKMQQEGEVKAEKLDREILAMRVGPTIGQPFVYIIDQGEVAADRTLQSRATSKVTEIIGVYDEDKLPKSLIIEEFEQRFSQIKQ